MSDGDSTNQDQKQNPLQALVVGEEMLAEKELAETLMPFLRFTESGELLLEGQFENLNTTDKTLCALLGARALQALGKRSTAELRNMELIDLTGMPEGTVASNVKKLKEARTIQKGEGGGWTITNHALRRVVDDLKLKGGRGSDGA